MEGASDENICEAITSQELADRRIERSKTELLDRQTDQRALCRLYESLPAVLDAPANDLRDTSCIIFDWDDTLFPTWYVENVVKPCSHGEPLHMAPLFLEPMALHAAVVKELLKTARKLARVAIVTLALSPWVHDMAKTYWHDFDFEELLSELEIPIYYARDRIAKIERRQKEEGVDLFEVAKRKAMSKCLRVLEKKSGCMPSNIISIGDSPREHQALKDVMWEHCEYSFCKTVLLAEDPPLATLTNELRIISPCIGRMVAVQRDLELDAGSADDLLSALGSEAGAHVVQVEVVSCSGNSADTLPAQVESVPLTDPKKLKGLIRQHMKRGKPKALGPTLACDLADVQGCMPQENLSIHS